jgi:nitrite reductase/ring-hydroxylating ferredoxin subunit
MTHEQSVAVPAESEMGDTACCARRSVLRGALALGAVGLGGTLTGCGSKGSSDTASSGAPPAGPSSTASTPSSMPASAGSTPEASAAPSSASSSAAASSGTSLGSTSKVPVGGGNVFGSQKIVVTQPTAGQYKAFTAVCTHEQCTVGDVSGGTINCYCHGSKFSITDGSVVHGPAASPLAAKNVTISGDSISLQG